MRQILRTIGLMTLLLAVLAGAQPQTVNAQVETGDTTRPMLAPKLDSMKTRFESRAPEDRIKLYQGAIDDLRSSGILERALNVGDTVPQFTLPDAVGDSVSLHSYLAKGPVVVVWYRGGWCPYCNMTLHTWVDYVPEVTALGATMLAISPEIPDSSLSTKEKHHIPFAVLSDHGNDVARQFGIVFKLPDDLIEAYSQHFSLAEYNGDESYELPLAATYVIDTDGVIRYAFLDADYKNRAEPSDVIAALKGVAKQ